MLEGKDYPSYLDYPKPYKPQTNADRIRAMSDEELLTFLCDTTECGLCLWFEPKGCTLGDWLKQSAKGE